MASQHHQQGWSWVIIWPAVWLLHVGLWLLFAGQVSLHEVLAGLAGAAIAVVSYGAVWRHGHVPFAPSISDILQAWRLPWYVINDTGKTLQGLGQQLFTSGGAPSVMRAVPNEWGGNDPRAIARRALGITYSTLTPNSVVLDILPPPSGNGHALFLYHQIIPQEMTEMAKQLGAGAGRKERK